MIKRSLILYSTFTGYFNWHVAFDLKIMPCHHTFGLSTHADQWCIVFFLQNEPSALQTFMAASLGRMKRIAWRHFLTKMKQRRKQTIYILQKGFSPFFAMNKIIIDIFIEVIFSIQGYILKMLMHLLNKIPSYFLRPGWQTVTKIFFYLNFLSVVFLLLTL